jgi:hypothetical protein
MAVVTIVVFSLLLWRQKEEVPQLQPKTEHHVDSSGKDQPEGIRSDNPSAAKVVAKVEVEEFPEFTLDHIQEEIYEEIDQRAGQEMFFAGVKKHDENRMRRFGPTEEQLSQMSTSEAFEFFVTRPFMTVIFYHEDYFTGAERLLRVSRPLRELVGREDFPTALIEIIQRDIIDPADIEDPNAYVKGGPLEVYQPHIKTAEPDAYRSSVMGILTTLYAERNVLLMHPQIIQKLSGHELVLIKELRRQHRQMVEVNEKYGSKGDGDPLNQIHRVNIFINYKLAVELLEQYDQNLLSAMNPNTEMDVGPSEIDSFYEKTESLIK